MRENTDPGVVRTSVGVVICIRDLSPNWPRKVLRKLFGEKSKKETKQFGSPNAADRYLVIVHDDFVTCIFLSHSLLLTKQRVPTRRRLYFFYGKLVRTSARLSELLV